MHSISSTLLIGLRMSLAHQHAYDHSKDNHVVDHDETQREQIGIVQGLGLQHTPKNNKQEMRKFIDRIISCPLWQL